MMKKNPAKSMRKWHRRLGIASSVFLIIVVLSGVLINHANDLGLDKSAVEQDWLLDVYGIQAPKKVRIFDSSTPVLAISDNLLWLGEQRILEAPSTLLATTKFKQQILAIDEQHLYLFDANGNLIEKQYSGTGLPANLIKIAALDDAIWLQTAAGFYQSDAALIEWQATELSQPLAWIKPLDNVDTTHFVRLARSANLTWERVLLDLHSGRIFGSWAIWFWDFVSLILLTMLSLGIGVWLKQR